MSNILICLTEGLASTPLQNNMCAIPTDTNQPCSVDWAECEVSKYTSTSLPLYDVDHLSENLPFTSYHVTRIDVLCMMDLSHNAVQQRDVYITGVRGSLRAQMELKISLSDKCASCSQTLMLPLYFLPRFVLVSRRLGCETCLCCR